MNQTLRVLIVDDEASQRAGLAGMVKAWGMVAETASDGLEALEKLSQMPIDVVLTDLNMPGLSGVELQSRLLADGYRMPIIFITAFSEETARARAMKAGAICFMSKPYREDRLIDCLDRALKAPDPGAA